MAYKVRKSRKSPTVKTFDKDVYPRCDKLYGIDLHARGDTVQRNYRPHFKFTSQQN
jgi:hypothetical protein